MTISVIAATAENNVIGKDNELIWHISEDLKRFKKLTSGHPIIMGRKTYDSLPFKPLPNRKNIILSSKKKIEYKDAIVLNSKEAVLKECKNEDEIFICGGAEIYKLFMPIADKIYLTKVHHNFEGDTFFPKFNISDWKINTESEIYFDKKSKLYYSFCNYFKNSTK